MAKRDATQSKVVLTAAQRETLSDALVCYAETMEANAKIATSFDQYAVASDCNRRAQEARELSAEAPYVQRVAVTLGVSLAAVA